MFLNSKFLTYADCIYIDGDLFEFIFRYNDYYLDLGINFSAVSFYRESYGNKDSLLVDCELDEFEDKWQFVLIDELIEVGIIDERFF